jgi:hypothetical protein
VVYPQVRVLEGATLQFGLGIDPQAWSSGLDGKGVESDGIEFQVWVRDGTGDPVEVYRQYLDPGRNPEHRRWLDASVDLDRFAGRTVELHLVTSPGPVGDARYDWGGWSAPRLVAPVTQDRHEGS